MKKVIFLVIFTLLVIPSCVHLPSEEIGLVRFQVSTGEQMRSLYAIEDAHSLIVSIEDSEGGVVYDMKNILLYKMGEGFISETLALEVGEYRLTEFLVLDDQGQVIFATPIEGSEKAYLVDDPLPIEFSVCKDEVTKVTPEVLDTEGAIPEDFGYSGFSFEVVETFVFLVSVFVATETGMELTESQLSVTSGVEVLYSGSLGAETNVIEVRDGYVMYNLKVEKDGYESYEQSFSNEELRGYFEKPLEIFFGAAVTCSISGRVTFETTSGEIGFRGVTMTLSGAAAGTATTDAGGNYTFSDLTEGESYTVSPDKLGYLFSADWSGTLDADVTDAHFTATGPSYYISGNVWGEGPAAGIAMTLDTTPAITVYTDEGGWYITVPVPNGTYTLTPSLTGSNAAFYPPEKTLTVEGENLGGENFNYIFTYSVSGEVNYSGTKTGWVYINVTNEWGWTTGVGTSILVGSESWPSYTIRGVRPGTYTMTARMDNIGNGEPHASNPVGTWVGFDVVNSDITVQTIDLEDPAAVTPEDPEIYAVFPGDQSAMVLFEGPGDEDDMEIAQSYNLYWSTNPDVINDPEGMASIPLNELDVYIVHGLTDSDHYYFVITVVIDGIESAESIPYGPVTIGAAEGNYTVLGKINLSQEATGPMWVFVYGGGEEEDFLVYYTYIDSPSMEQEYSISGVPAGGYYLFVLVDMNDTGVMDIGDYVIGYEGEIELEVIDQNVTQDYTFSLLPNASAAVSTSHWPNDWDEGYSLDFEVEGGLKIMVKASLMGGPNIPGIIDLGLFVNEDSSIHIQLGSTRPIVGDTYTFEFTYSDSTTETMQASVTTVLDSFATPIYPNEYFLCDTQPTFEWDPPASPPLFYEYSISVWDSMGWQIWWASSILDSETSVDFNFDDEAEQESLDFGTTYNWSIEVIDADGNSASSGPVEFTTVDAP